MWQKIVETSRKPRVILGATSAVSLAVGCVSGYYLAKSRVEARFEEKLVEELDKSRRFYASLSKVQEFETPLSDEDDLEQREASVEPDAVKHAEETVRHMGYWTGSDAETPVPTEADLLESAVEEVAEVLEEAAEEVRNVFVGESSLEFDYDKEVPNRTSTVPYVITFDEFSENTPEFDQVSMTYYEGDDALTDASERLVPEIEEVIGKHNLAFGYGSLDPNVVYVRSESSRMDFSITRSFGKYGVEVLGFPDPDDEGLKHSGRPRLRKFRDADE